MSSSPSSTVAPHKSAVQVCVNVFAGFGVIWCLLMIAMYVKQLWPFRLVLVTSSSTVQEENKSHNTNLLIGDLVLLGVLILVLVVFNLATQGK
jgi:hypothetical protein